MLAKPLQLCPTLCDPLDCSPPVPSVHVILHAGILEKVAITLNTLTCIILCNLNNSIKRVFEKLSSVEMRNYFH